MVNSTQINQVWGFKNGCELWTRHKPGILPPKKSRFGFCGWILSAKRCELDVFCQSQSCGKQMKHHFDRSPRKKAPTFSSNLGQVPTWFNGYMSLRSQLLNLSKLQDTQQSEYQKIKIAKGTTDPRVEFPHQSNFFNVTSKFNFKISTKFQRQNLDWVS